MKKTTWIWNLSGFALTSLGGTLLHFLFEWSGSNLWLAPFSGVNESTWEHMKLLFWPMILFSVLQAFFFREDKAFLCVKLRTIALGLVLIPVIFYTYNGVIGKSPDWINIAIFFISAAIAYAYEGKLLTKETTDCKYPRLAAGILCLLAILFVIFTFYTPKLGIFQDPVTGAYGISGEA